MYRVYYTFRNSLGEDVRTFLDDNGNGFRPYDALDVARQLGNMGNRYVSIVRIGSLADTEEQDNLVTQ